MYFYQILSDIMEQRNLKIADVARMCNIADSTVRSIMSRKQKTVALDVAFKLSDGLNVSLEVLNGSKPKENNKITINDKEERLITAYRNNPDMQPAINKMLDIEAAVLGDIADDIKNEITEDIKKVILKSTSLKAK